jgi:hypothetical protein
MQSLRKLIIINSTTFAHIMTEWSFGIIGTGRLECVKSRCLWSEFLHVHDEINHIVWSLSGKQKRINKQLRYDPLDSSRTRFLLPFLESTLESKSWKKHVKLANLHHAIVSAHHQLESWIQVVNPVNVMLISAHATFKLHNFFSNVSTKLFLCYMVYMCFHIWVTFQV